LGNRAGRGARKKRISVPTPKLIKKMKKEFPQVLSQKLTSKREKFQRKSGNFALKKKQLTSRTIKR